MNITKLFETQRKLDERIEREHPRQEGRDRLAEKILALQVEVGECANEARSWKFWSHDQKPRGEGIYLEYGCTCPGMENKWVKKNPLLEEYVDGLHFVLSLGLELKIDIDLIENELKDFSKWVAVEKQFIYILHLASYFPYINDRDVVIAYYISLITNFVGLGEMLGFTHEQIEKAYFAKNKINHERQESGY